ncbi:helix-turn-helix domain-containing protein [Olsenella sp. YH-ols2221]|uniref:helix-turn-helix domain-containing protein n=1 Tax=Olsenella kribbiana TaxID=3115221 RepID=UPI002EDACA98
MDSRELRHWFKPLYRVSEVAELLGVSRAEAYRLAKTVDAIKLGSSIRIPYTEVIKLIEKRGRKSNGKKAAR